jgi:transaldolase
LSEAGVAVWLDDLSRERIESGSLARDMETYSVVGVTTNPSIFANAISSSDQYDAQLADLAARKVTVDEAVRMITTADVRAACDVLRPAFDASEGIDGRVSIEVDPRLARDTVATVAEAKQLWWLVDRPNLFIKIPATVEGLPAITEVLSLGISVNVTLIFSLERYAAVVEAFMAGLEAADAKGLPLGELASVASFFISRVDAEVDKRLDAAGPGNPVRGKAAIANARLAFEHHENVMDSDRWQALAAKGAHPQRPLWASTSVKDPAYPDTQYVDQLVARGTVNTMPESTIKALADHGEVPDQPALWDTVRSNYVDARQALEQLAAAGVDLADVTEQLEREGVDKFADAWAELLAHVQQALNK